MYNTVFYIIIIIILLEFFFNFYLKFINSKYQSTTLPSELQGIYDAEKFEKSQMYQKANLNLSNISSIFSIILTLSMFFFGGFKYVDSIAKSFSNNPIVISLIFFGIILFITDLISTPFDIYDTFVIEQKFGFNKTTPFLYFKDKLIGLLLTGLLGGGLLALILWFYLLTTINFWIYAWGLVTLFSVFGIMFYSNLIVPLFNKQTPLPEGELRTAIQEFSSKVGFSLDNIYQIDGSKRSSKANAYFTGLGSKKRIVLYDTLINEMTIPEIVAVLAHEIGHYKHKHTKQGILISIIQTGIILFIFSLFVDNLQLSQALGVKTSSFHINMIAFGTIFSPISTVIGLFMNILSRKNEYQADKFAADNFDAKHLASSLKKLSINNLSNLTPHPFYVFVNYSHPSLLQRLNAINKNK